MTACAWPGCDRKGTHVYSDGAAHDWAGREPVFCSDHIGPAHVIDMGVVMACHPTRHAADVGQAAMLLARAADVRGAVIARGIRGDADARRRAVADRLADAVYAVAELIAAFGIGQDDWDAAMSRARGRLEGVGMYEAGPCRRVL